MFQKHDVEELEPITLESLGANTGAAYQAVPQDIPAPSPAVQAVAPAKDLVPLPPQGPYKPTDIEIQTALKNARLLIREHRRQDRSQEQEGDRGFPERQQPES